MDSDDDDDLDKLVAAQLIGTHTTNNVDNPKVTQSLATRVNPAAGSDEELDALIHEALAGVPLTPTTKKAITTKTTTITKGEEEKVTITSQPLLRKEKPETGMATKKETSPVVRESMDIHNSNTYNNNNNNNNNSSRSRSSSSENSRSSGEEILQAVLAGHGIPPLEGIDTHISDRQEFKPFSHYRSLPPHKDMENKTNNNNNNNNNNKEEDEEECILMETLSNLVHPPVQFVSKNRRQNVSTSMQENPKKGEEEEEEIRGGGGGSSGAAVSSGNKNIGISSKTLNHTGIDNKEDTSHSKMDTNSLKNTLPSPKHPTRRESETQTKSLHAFQELEDEKQILNAILNAVQDRQSSVSGDLVYDEDGYNNVEAVLQHAEGIAASSLRGENGKGSHIMHLHEHVEMREELRKARGSVGWPSCVCGRTIAIESLACGESTQIKTSNSISTSLSKRPTLCIGTTLGVILLFNEKTKMCGMCGSVGASTVEMRGVVVSLSMSCDALIVFSGHERGTIIMWDTDSLTALREISDEYTTPITRLRHFCMDSSRVIVLSSNGSVKLLSFTRIISRMMYRLTNIAVSVPEAPFNDIDLVFLKGEGLYLVAAVSADTLLLSAVDCGLQTIVTPIMRRTRPPKSARIQELLQFVSVNVEDRILLCVAWGADIEIFTIATGGILSEFHRLANVRLERPLHAMTPIINSCLVLIDQNESLHLLDASVGVVVETQVLHGVDPVVFSSRSCGMRYNGAIAQNGNSVIILGRRRAFTCTLLSWNVRLDILVRQKRYVEALELAKDFALEVALAVVGLQSNPVSRRESIHSYLVGLIKAYLSHLTEMNNTPHEVIVKCIRNIIQFCVDIDAMDVFFGPAMELLRRTTASDALALYALEGCILTGTVTTLPEMYIQPFFNLFANDKTETLLNTWDASSQGSNVITPLRGIMRAERALMRLEGSYELLMQIAKKYNLVRLAVAILSYRQFKYVEAFRLSLSWDPSGNVALYYFECTMKGYTILGDVELSDYHSRIAKEQLWNHLLSITDDFTKLLHINPEIVLQSTFLSLQDRPPYSPWEEDLSLKQRCISKLFIHIIGVDLSTSNTLRPWELARREWPPYIIVHELFSGLTRILLTGTLELGDNIQQFCEHACSHFIYQFQTAEDESQRRSVQSEAAALLSSSVTKNVDFSFAEEELQQQRMARTLSALYCSRGKFGEAIDCYLDKENNRADAGLAKDVFRVIREEMSFLLHIGEEELSHQLREAVMHRISLLVNVDATSLAQFVLEYLPGNHDEVMNILRNSGETFLRYLDELIAKGDPAVANDVKLQNTYIELLCAHEPTRVYPYLDSQDSIITYDLHLALHAVKRYKIADAAVFLLEKTLMIDEAMKILIGAVADKLRIVRQEVIKKVISSSEEKDDITSSESPLSKMIKEEEKEAEKEREKEGKGMKNEDNELQKKESHNKEIYLLESEKSLQQVLGVGIDLCTKYNNDLSFRSSGNWFTLLEIFTRPRRLLCDRQRQQQTVVLQSGCEPVDGFEDDEINASPASDNSLTNTMFPLLSNPLSLRGVMFLDKMIAIYTKYVSLLLTEMIKVLDLSQVIGRIVKDHEGERFGPFKPVIVDIMSSLSFELEVNRLCKLCIDNDIVVLANQLHRGYKTGVVPLSDTCYICNENLVYARSVEVETSVRIYACGHGYHESCVLNFSSGADCVQCQKERSGNLQSSVTWQQVSDNNRVGVNKRKNSYSGTSSNTSSNNNNNNNNNNSHEENERKERKEEGRVLQDEDISLIIRRLRQTRAKIDGVREYQEMLRGFLQTKQLQTITTEFPKETMGKNLLAPAPPIPVSLGDFSEEALDFNGPFTAILTDEDMLELFGTSEESDDKNESEDNVLPALINGSKLKIDGAR